MKNTNFVTFLLAILFLISMCGNLMAKELHFVTLEYPPLVYRDSNGLINGAAVEIVSTIINELGHSLSIEIMPWTRALKMVQFGKADAIFTIFRNQQREKFLDFSNEVLIPQVVSFYALKNSTVIYSGDLKKLRNYKIGVVSTISYGNHFDQARPFLIVESTATLEQNFNKMMLGRIDLLINNIYSADIEIQKLDIGNKVVQLQPCVENVPSYISFSKVRQLTDLRNKFDDKLIELKRNGTYYQIIKKSGIDLQKYGFE